MKQSYPPESIINYLLDILEINPVNLPQYLRNSPFSLFSLANHFGIYLYLAAWSLEQRYDYIPDNFRIQLEKSLAANKARNILLSLQMAKLAKLFKNADIPLMFLKGAAGFIRGICPLEWRFLSDIDVLVPSHSVHKSRNLLQSAGYLPEQNSHVPSYHHHIKPYCHPDHVGGIEIHIEPYDLSILDRPVMPRIWQDADKLQFKKEEMIVPSLTDHVWILMRTEAVGNVFLPRLKEVIEMTLILNKEHSIDYNLLIKRAEHDNIQNIVRGMSYACSRYMGIKPFVSIEDPLLRHWEDWSIKQQRNILNTSHFKASRRRFGAATFLTSRGIIPKVRFYKWLTRYEFLKDLSNSGIVKGLSPLIKFWRIFKNVTTYIIFALEYIAFRIDKYFTDE